MAVPSCIRISEWGRNSLTLNGASGTGLAHNLGTQGEVGMISSNQGKKSPPCINIHTGTWGQLKPKQSQVSPLRKAVRHIKSLFYLPDCLKKLTEGNWLLLWNKLEQTKKKEKKKGGKSELIFLKYKPLKEYNLMQLNIKRQSSR